MTAPLRVLHVGKYYPPHMGGIETHLRALCSELQHHVDLRVVVFNDGRKTVHERPDGFELTRLATWFHLSTAPVAPALVGEIDRAGADIVHIHLPNPAALLAWQASRRRAALVLSWHSDIVRQRFAGTALTPLVRAALRRAAAVVVSAPQNIESTPILHPFRSKCRVVPYGIDVEQFAAADPAEVARIRARHRRIVLAVGRQVYYKGFDVLIRAMRRVDGELLLVGTGPLHQALRRQAAEWGVSGRVHFLADVEDVRPLFAAADVFVLPSVARSEAFGIVQVEAMAAGTPVVNTRLDSGVPWVSPDGLTGLTVPPADDVALADAIGTLLSDEGLRRRLGDAGRARAAKEFSIRRMTERILDVYGGIDSAPGPV